MFPVWHPSGGDFSQYVVSVELSGLVLAAIVGAVILYVVPVRVATRYAVVTSREGDRFDAGLALVPVAANAQRVVADSSVKSKGSVVALRLPEPSTRSILSTQGTRPKGADMSDPSKADTQPSREETPSEPVRLHPAREYAALRASRAARRSVEAAAARRRIVELGLAAVVFLVFTGFAAAGKMTWTWLFLPGVAMVATVASSMFAAERTRRRDAADAAELAELRKTLASVRKRQTQRGTAKAHFATLQPHQPTQGQGKKSDVTTVKADAPAKALANTEAPVKREAPPSIPVGASEEVTEASRPEKSVVDEASVVVEESVEVATEDIESEVVDVVEVVEEKKVEERGWEVVTLPPPIHSVKRPVKARQVHPDTDLVALPAAEQAGVPVRPQRKSTGFAASTSTPAESATGPTFKFDLDSVLDQRRAQ